MIYKIYYKDHKHDMSLTSSSNHAYKYLWSDMDLDDSKEDDELFIRLNVKKDQPLIFNKAEDAFDFIEKEKDNFAYSNNCFVIAQK